MNKSGVVAVIMSVYDGDEVISFIKALNSVYDQSFELFDIYLYVDGVKNKKLIDVINNNSKKKNFFVEYGDKKRGLAFGLNSLIKKISRKGYGYIARMDSDDICVPERFKVQVEFLNNNKEISVVGSNCIEINSKDEFLFDKLMPEFHNDILTSVIKRSPFIHPSVMFRGSMINDIKYNNKLQNTQDYYLWVSLISKGYKFHNIQKPLIYFRVSDTFYKRRGGGKIFNEVKSRFYAMRLLKKYSCINFLYIVLLFLLRLSPTSVKKFCYMRFR